MRMRWGIWLAVVLATGCATTAEQRKAAKLIERGQLIGNHYENRNYCCQWDLVKDWKPAGDSRFLALVDPRRRHLYVKAVRPDGHIWAALHIYRLKAQEKNAWLDEVIAYAANRKTYKEDRSTTVDLPGMDIAKRIEYRARYRGKKDGPPMRTAVIAAAREGIGFLAEVGAFDTDFRENSATIDQVMDSFGTYEPIPQPPAELATRREDRPTTKPPSAAPEKPAEDVKHVVQKGETLETIVKDETGSEKNVAEVRGYNQIKSSEDFNSRKTIVIPGYLRRQKN